MDPDQGARKLGIIAGGGALPKRLIDACRASGREFFVLALEGQADPRVVAGQPHAWVRIGAIGAALKHLRNAGVKDLVMAGRVARPSLLTLRPDATGAMWLARIGMSALGDDGLLRAVVKELEGEGFRVVGADAVLNDLLVTVGALGRLMPDVLARSDIEHGVKVARGLGVLDVGQAVVVQQGIVLGVEAIEGTDALLARCGGLRREGPGGVLVKLSKPGQERRADLPTIGDSTIKNAAASGLRGIAIEAGRTLVLDRDAIAAAADAAGLFLVAVE